MFFKPDGAGIAGDKMVEALRKRGVLLAMMDGRIRACTHLDVSAAMIEETVGIVREIVRAGVSEFRQHQQCAPATAHCRAGHTPRRSTSPASSRTLR